MSEVVELEYARRTVPKDSLGVLDNFGKNLFCLRTYIQTFPTVRYFVYFAELSVGVVRERVGNLGIYSQYEVYAFFFCFFQQFESQIQLVVFADGKTDFTALSFGESVSHTAGDNQIIYLVQQVFDDFNLGRYFGTAHDSSERTWDVIQHLVYSFHFFLHQVAEHLVVFVEVFGDQCRRSVCTVSGTECVVYVAVSVRSKFLGKLFLAFLNGSFGSFLFFVCRIFGQTARFAFFFSIETKVFEQQHFTRLQSGSLNGSFFAHAVVGELYLNTQQF